jgi:hypothetical protein
LVPGGYSFRFPADGIDHPNTGYQPLSMHHPKARRIFFTNALQFRQQNIPQVRGIPSMERGSDAFNDLKIDRDSGTGIFV